MKIINETRLSYKEIGNIIDQMLEESKGTTHYVGQVELSKIETGYGKGIYIKPIIIGVQIRYLKKYCEWKFVEMER